MAKKSMTPSERREAILRVLCQRRQDKIDNLAEEFGVSVRTIKNDIEELTLAHPIETVRGTSIMCIPETVMRIPCSRNMEISN